jgi:hypothetical protein
MQTTHVANATSALLGTHALLVPSPVSPRRPLTSAIWPSPRALSPRPLPAATGSLDDFVKRQDAENQKRLQVRPVFMFVDFMCEQVAYYLVLMLA